MNTRQKKYWAAQILGWGILVVVNILSASSKGTIVPEVFFLSACWFLFGILFSHSFRWIVYRLDWKSLSIPKLILLTLISSFITGGLFIVLFSGLQEVIFNNSDNTTSGNIEYLFLALSFSVFFIFWCIIYFAVHFFENFKAEEIKNLELKAANTEIELNSFKSQMNPHFMFNSLNSIRALVDEDPDKAKRAITLLSGMFRGTLSMGRRQLVPFKEELEIVKKYLEMEKIRFEERLLIEFDLDQRTFEKMFPPFMLQTIVENGVKHGIGTLKDGGIIRVMSRVENDNLIVQVINSGTLKNDIKESRKKGIGLSNTLTRLNLIYADNASLHISSDDNYVTVQLTIPFNKVQTN